MILDSVVENKNYEPVPEIYYLQNNSSSESSANLADNASMAARSGSKSLVMISLTKSMSISK